MLKVSGFPELTPEEKIIEEEILGIIRKNYQQVGYTPIETPAVERNHILTAKSGNEVSKQIFGLYGLAQGCKDIKDYSLHFDLTVPFARYIVDHRGELNFPFKRSQIQKVWRGERAQKGRFREFYQADIDVIWNENSQNNKIDKLLENSISNSQVSKNLLYDAEIIFILVKTLKDIFQKLGLNYPFKVKINNKKVISGFLKYLSIGDKNAEIITIIDKKDKVSPKEFIKLLEKKGLTKEQIGKIQQFINQDLQTAEKINLNNEYLLGLKELKQVIKFLDGFGVSEYEVDFGIVRGLDYYTGIVFETFIDNELHLGSIASGGRYENFTKFIDKKTNFSGVGGSIGISRLESFIFDKIQLNRKTTSEYLIINFQETTFQCLKLFTNFLREGKKVEFYPQADKLKKQLKYANRKGIKYCIILGESEVNKNYYILKNMETGEQKKIGLNL